LAAPAVVPRFIVVSQQGIAKHIARAAGARGYRRYICWRERHTDVEG